MSGAFWFIMGFLAGGCFGVILMCLMMIADDYDGGK